MKTVLYADDSKSLRELVQHTLTEAGYKVILAEDGVEALSKLTEEVDLVLTDFNMPNKNGIEVIEGVRKDPKHKVTPILLLTTESEQEMKIKAKDAGASGWVVKPFQAEKLIATIKKIIR